MFNLVANACGYFDPNGCVGLNAFIGQFVIPTMQAIAIGLAGIYLLYGGMMYIMSAGDEKATKKATDTLTNAAIGLAVALLVFILLGLLRSIVGAGTNPTTPSVPSNFIPAAPARSE